MDEIVIRYKDFLEWSNRDLKTHIDILRRNAIFDGFLQWNIK